MKFEEFYKEVMGMNAAQLYENAVREIGARADFIYLAYGDITQLLELYMKEQIKE